MGTLSLFKKETQNLRKKMENQLKDIFSNINDWLKFAETKTATLLAGNGMIIFGLFRIFKDSNEIHNAYISTAIILLSLSIFTNLLSLIPSLKVPFLLLNKDTKKNDNLLYFLDIAKYETNNYLKKLNNSIEKFTDFEKYYAEQIIINSKIALMKYRLFKIAIILTSFAIFIILIALINYLY
jgi:hypothetical protein